MTHFIVTKAHEAVWSLTLAFEIRTFTIKVLPCSRSEITSIDPLCEATISEAMKSPKPNPSVGGWSITECCENRPMGLKMNGKTSFGTGSPPLLTLKIAETSVATSSTNIGVWISP